MKKVKRNVKVYDMKLSEQQQTLSDYLSQYKICIHRKKALIRRREDIIKEFDMPLSGVSMDGMPKGGGSSIGCASISIKLDEIESKIREQTEKATKILTDIMELTDFLDEGSIERAVIENKYIDRMSWGAICTENNISKSQAVRYWRKGLSDLLEYDRVKDILKSFVKKRKALEGI